MKITIKRENNEFLVITLKHISGLTDLANPPRMPKLWAIAHENGRKTRTNEISVLTLKHISGLTSYANHPKTPKL
jgi:hypothetical protein